MGMVSQRIMRQGFINGSLRYILSLSSSFCLLVCHCIILLFKVWLNYVCLSSRAIVDFTLCIRGRRRENGFRIFSMQYLALVTGNMSILIRFNDMRMFNFGIHVKWIWRLTLGLFLCGWNRLQKWWMNSLLNRVKLPFRFSFLWLNTTEFIITIFYNRIRFLYERCFSNL